MDTQLSLPLLPVETWDAIIGWVTDKTDLYWLALVNWNFAISVRRYLYPRLRMINKYNINLIDQHIMMSNMFIMDGVAACYLFDKQWNGYSMKLIKIYPEECHISLYENRIFNLDDTRILTATAEYLVLYDNFNIVTIINLLHKKPNNIIMIPGYVNHNFSIRANFVDDRLFIFVDYVCVSCKEYTITEDDVTLVAENVSVHSVIMGGDPKEKEHGTYAIDRNGWLIRVGDNQINIYAGTKEISTTKLVVNEVNILCANLHSVNYIYILSNDGAMFIFEY